jgi:hypothetical protein
VPFPMKLTNTYASTSNRMTAYSLSPGVAASPVWDSAGNLINDGQGLALAYDAKKRFVQVSDLLPVLEKMRHG